jgi:hypothetical protein
MVLLTLWLMVCAVGSVAHADLHDGLVGYYPFNGNANDASGNGNHGIEYGALTYTSGVDGEAASFDGIDDYIRLSENVFNDSTSAFTIAVWARRNDLIDTDTIVSLDFDQDADQNSGFVLAADLWSPRMDASLLGKSPNDWTVTASQVSSENTDWHFYVATGKNNDSLALYIDNTVQWRRSLSGKTMSFDTTNYDFIGGTVPTGDSSIITIRQTWYLDGEIDDLRIYDRVLSESEIEQLYLDDNGSDTGYIVAENLRIRAVIDTEEKGPVEAVFVEGGDNFNDRGDRVVWGYFYASPADVIWGNIDNPDLYVKVWFDVSGRIDVNYFHVSVPDIQVFSDYPSDGFYDQQGTTTLDNRYIRHEYWQ